MFFHLLFFSVEKIIYVLRFLVPAPPDLFSLPITDQGLVELQRTVDLYYSGKLPAGDYGDAEHPVMSESNPQTVAALLLVYLRMMPHPVVPPVFYWSLMRMANIPSTADRVAQIRIVIHKLPGTSRDLLLSLIDYMEYSQLPCDLLANLFANLILRPALDLTAEPPSALCANLMHTLIKNAAYLSFKQDAPNIPPNDSPSNAANFTLEAIAMFDYTGTLECINRTLL